MSTDFDEAQHPRDGSGQFTTKPAGESAVELTPDVQDGPGEAVRLARAGMVSGWGAEAAETIESLDGYAGGDTTFELQTVGSALSDGLAASSDDRVAMTLGLESGGDGIVGGYTVTGRFYDSNGVAVPVSFFSDMKQCTTDRGATGAAAFGAYADNLYGDYLHVEAVGRRLGLSPTEPPRDPDDMAAWSLETARSQMDAGRIAYEVQVAEQVGREIRTAWPDSVGADLAAHEEDGTFYVASVLGPHGATLWDSDDVTGDGLSDATRDRLSDPTIGSWSSPEGSPFASHRLRW